MMVSMSQTRSRPWSVGIAIAVVLLPLLLIAPPLLFGESLSPFGLLLIAGSLLGSGLLMRLQANVRLRAAGTVLAVVGIVSIVLAVGLLALALGRWGRY